LRLPWLTAHWLTLPHWLALTWIHPLLTLSLAHPFGLALSIYWLPLTHRLTFAHGLALAHWLTAHRSGSHLLAYRLTFARRQIAGEFERFLEWLVGDF
jgi:hypothetical protein